MHSIFCHVHTVCNILARDFHIVLKTPLVLPMHTCQMRPSVSFVALSFAYPTFRARFTTDRADEPFRFLDWVAFGQTCPRFGTLQSEHK
jgi:hypothetical protein